MSQSSTPSTSCAASHQSENPMSAQVKASVINEKPNTISESSSFQGYSSINLNNELLKVSTEKHHSMGILSGLDRKAMERERLARVERKRKEQITSEEVREPESKRKKINSSPSVSKEEKSKMNSYNGIQYPYGVVKKTWVRGFPREGNEISIEEVLQKDDLTLAVLSTFQINADWIMEKLSPHTSIYWVLQARTEDEICFIIDLARHEDGKITDLEDLTPFGRELSYFLRAQGLPEKVIKSLGKFNFLPTASLGFVHSIGGSHTESSLNRTGYCGLAATVRNLGLQTQEPLRLDLVTASMGNINSKFIETLYLAAQGEVAKIQAPKSSFPCAALSKESETDLRKNVNKFCRIYFPTHDTVQNSLGGTRAGGTICFQTRWWKSNDFLQKLIRDSQSRRKGLLMHTKMWLVRPVKSEPYQSCRQSWAYIGSANLSESAWGRMVKDQKTKQAKLNCANWECGVIFPVKRENSSDKTYLNDSNSSCNSSQLQKAHNYDDYERDMEEEFQGHVPIPMVVPGAPYREKEPWCFM